MKRERFSNLIKWQSAVISAGNDLQEVFAATVAACTVMPQATGIVIELRDGDELYYAAASGTSADLIGLRLPLNASLSGMAILKGTPLTCEDSEQDERVNRDACRRVGLRSMIVAPIPHRGTTAGVLKFYSDAPGAFSKEDMMVAHLLVLPVAAGLSSIGEATAQQAHDEQDRLIQLRNDLVTTGNHELRTPLTAISGALSLVSSGAAGAVPEKALRLINLANRNAARLSRLVDDLLNLEQLGSSEMEMNRERVDLCKLMEEAAAQNAPYIDRFSVHLEVRCPSQEIWANLDPNRTLQVFANLLSNAAKFSPAGGTIRFSLKPNNGRAVITIEDDGPGIPLEFQSRIFGKFARGEQTEGSRSQPSTGLGLAITKEIVELLGGQSTLIGRVTKAPFSELLCRSPRKKAVVKRHRNPSKKRHSGSRQL